MNRHQGLRAVTKTTPFKRPKKKAEPTFLITGTSSLLIRSAN